MENGSQKLYRKVLFSDLDGTLINTIFGKEFPIACYDMSFKWEVFEAIKNYNPEVVFIVTNQGGIEKGFVNEQFFRNKLDWVKSVISEYCECDVIAIYCPTTNKDDELRKPNPGMVNKCIYSCCKQDCLEALMIGDREEDRKCAANANIDYFDVKHFVGMFGTAEPNK